MIMVKGALLNLQHGTTLLKLIPGTHQRAGGSFEVDSTLGRGRISFAGPRAHSLITFKNEKPPDRMAQALN